MIAAPTPRPTPRCAGRGQTVGLSGAVPIVRAWACGHCAHSDLPAQTSFAFRTISAPLNSLLTGQFFFALAASSWNLASSRPGTCASTFSVILPMWKPPAGSGPRSVVVVVVLCVGLCLVLVWSFVFVFVLLLVCVV